MLDPALKTIVHIPNVNSRESLLQGQGARGERIMHALGEWKGVDPATGFHRVGPRRPDAEGGRPGRRQRRGPAHARARRAEGPGAQGENRVDIIIALGMAKRGLTGSGEARPDHWLPLSLTEIVQIIAAPRDAKGKERARFTNLIAEPAADQGPCGGERHAQGDFRQPADGAGAGAVMNSRRGTPVPRGFNYGEQGYLAAVKYRRQHWRRARFIWRSTAWPPKTPEATRICREDLNEVVTSFPCRTRRCWSAACSTWKTRSRRIDAAKRMGKIVRERFPN